VEKRTILVQLDTDQQPSLFDKIVALDAGAQMVLSYAGVRPADVRGIVHGAIFTRGPRDLRRTALFIGGSDVAAAERLFDEARRHLLPQYGLQVSVLLDPSGANTTAAAAVRVTGRHVPLADARAVVLGGTGPVGQRVVRLLARQGAEVCVCSRQVARAEAVCQAVRQRVAGARLEAVGVASDTEAAAVLADRTLVVAAGAAGAILLPESTRAAWSQVKVAIDLNAVPPSGIEGIEVTDRAADRDGVICYGAVGVGDTKMKIHKAAVARLFERNDQILDAEEIATLADAV
jgi:hypothetical protein